MKTTNNIKQVLYEGGVSHTSNSNIKFSEHIGNNLDKMINYTKYFTSSGTSGSASSSGPGNDYISLWHCEVIEIFSDLIGLTKSQKEYLSEIKERVKNNPTKKLYLDEIMKNIRRSDKLEKMLGGDECK
jgi:hypothetical protein